MYHQSKATYSPPTSSPSLRALEHIHMHTLVQETQMLLHKSEDEQKVHFSISPRKRLPQVPVTLKRLKQASDQIAEIQIWLRTHPDLLFVFDEALRREFRRTSLVTLLMNVFFTIAGALLGYLLPQLLHWFPLLR